MQVVSTMGSGSLGRELDLEALVTGIEDLLDNSVESNFQGTSMVTIRLKEDGPAYTIYRTGSFQIRGAKTVDRLYEAATRFCSILEEIGVESAGFEFEVSNLVCLEDFSHEFNLEQLAVLLGLENIEYEPEQFPGLVYRPPEASVTMLIFSSGKVIIGGARERGQAVSAVEHLRDELSEIGEIG